MLPFLLISRQPGWYSAFVQELYNGHGWKVTHEEAPLPDGRTKKTARAERPDSVHIIAFQDPEHILMLREFRPFYGDYIWMLPSGKVDKETDIAAGAQRELREETGYKAAELKHLWSANIYESLKNTTHIFIAKALTKDPLPQDAHEMIEVHSLVPHEALENVLSSKNVHLPSAYALLRLLREEQTSP